MSIVPNVQGYAYLGCYIDPTNRILDAALKVDKLSLTVQSCGLYCGGEISPNRNYQFMGVEFGEQCFCGSSLNKTLTPISNTACNQRCVGSSEQYCGASSIIGVYTATQTAIESASTTLSICPGAPTSSSVSPTSCRNSPTAIIATAVVAGVLALALSVIVTYLLMSRKRKVVNPTQSVVFAPEKSVPTNEMEDTSRVSRQDNVAELEVAYPARELLGTTEGRRFFQ